MHSPNEGKKDDKEAATQHFSTPLPAIQQEPSHNVYSMPVGTNVNLPGGVPVLPVLLPWQHTQFPHTNLFDAQHNTMHYMSNRKVTKKEPWFKKFKYRYVYGCVATLCISNKCYCSDFRPMSEDRAAVVIQRYCRGYLTRRNLEFQQYLANRWLANRLLDKIIDETLQADMIPDVLIELLQERMNCGGWVCYQ